MFEITIMHTNHIYDCAPHLCIRAYLGHLVLPAKKGTQKVLRRFRCKVLCINDGPVQRDKNKERQILEFKCHVTPAYDPD